MFDWLQNIADLLTYSIFGFSAESKLGSAVDFFMRLSQILCKPLLVV